MLNSVTFTLGLALLRGFQAQGFAILFQTTKRLEIQCALECRAKDHCLFYLFQDHLLTTGGDANPGGNCILLSPIDSGQEPFTYSIGFGHHWAHRVSSSTTVNKKIAPGDVQMSAIVMGYELSVRVGLDQIFLKQVPGFFTPSEAELHCFAQGGILPMEDSDEVIEAMSNLLGDASTPRLVSLVREIHPDGSKRTLSWTLGRKEYDEGAGRDPKFADWPASNFDHRHFAVNPRTKSYEPVPIDQSVSNLLCQFLGKNLATGKLPLVSSWSNNDPQYRPSNAVDGNMASFWHSHTIAPIKPDWIAVDLGSKYTVTHILFLAREDCCAGRIKMVTAWVGDKAPMEKTAFVHSDFTQCGLYPYQQGDYFLSGVTCQSPLLGRFVALVNFEGGKTTHFVEIGIFGA